MDDWLVVFMNDLSCLLMYNWFVDFVYDLFLDHWLHMLVNDLLMMFMNHIFVLFMDHFLMMLVNYIFVLLFDYWFLNVLDHIMSYCMFLDICWKDFLLNDGLVNMLKHHWCLGSNASSDFLHIEDWLIIYLGFCFDNCLWIVLIEFVHILVWTGYFFLSYCSLFEIFLIL